MSDWYLDLNLRVSYSSELGAATAYAGHARHIRVAAHRDRVEQVRIDELHHREQLGRMMEARGVRPWRWLDTFFWLVGSTVAFGCRYWGDWASARGAGWFELNGVAEYRRLEKAALRVGNAELAREMGEMAVQEQAHRDLFLAMCGGESAVLPGPTEP